LPEPQLNIDVYDAHGGWLARVDTLWLAAGVVGEYYAGVHGGSWAGDLTRSAQLEDAGFPMVVTARDLKRPPSATHQNSGPVPLFDGAGARVGEGSAGFGVHVAPSPGLARLERAHHRVASSAEVPV